MTKIDWMRAIPLGLIGGLIAFAISPMSSALITLVLYFVFPPFYTIDDKED